MNLILFLYFLVILENNYNMVVLKYSVVLLILPVISNFVVIATRKKRFGNKLTERCFIPLCALLRTL